MELAAARGQEDRWVACLFDRVVCGVDGSPTSQIAVVQARRVATPGTTLELVSVVERSPAGWPRHAPDEARQYYEAQLALEAARKRAARIPVAAPLRGAGDGARRRRRTPWRVVARCRRPARRPPRTDVLGRVGTHLLEQAPCSLLIARHGDEQALFPEDDRSRARRVGGRGVRMRRRGRARAATRCSLQILVARGGDPVREEGLPVRRGIGVVAALSGRCAHRGREPRRPPRRRRPRRAQSCAAGRRRRAGRTSRSLLRPHRARAVRRRLRRLETASLEERDRDREAGAAVGSRPRSVEH